MVVSKPPAADGRRGRCAAHAAALAHAGRCSALLGPGQPDLTETAAAVVAGGRRHLGRSRALDRRGPPPAGPAAALRGLFAGGTLCDEAMLVASAALGPVALQHPARPGLGARRRPGLRRPHDASTSATTG